MRRRAFLAALPAALLATRAGAEEAAPSAAALATPVDPPRDAAALLIRDGEGRAAPLSAHEGRIVVLNLWAPWCLPCRREMPSLARLALWAEGRALSVLPVSFDWRGPAAVRRFYAEEEIEGLPVLTGEGKNLHAVLGLERLPTTAILDRAGRHVLTVAGEAVWDDAATLAWLENLT